ncbi:MAG TPA: asparagine synthase (glutamine-hydrolyzing) [Pyrinomonadaceae bacterium]|nr:asparagine synthase (glutamine-hydrolyzing) [Pyrinomonadaceae bacterium]
MCGIVGVAGDLSRAESLRVVQKMNDAILHRGPDDEGAWAQDGFAFAMRRLSIIDLAGGHQPMWDEQSGLGVVFNGEVYNYRALRRRLEDRGQRHWATQSDTEVVLRSLVEAGERAVQDWNGMFAVAAWNKVENSLLLIRDRLGVKPLYYFWDGRTLLFASELKAILASGLVERRVNRQAVWDYLTFRYVPGPESVWEGVRKLPPGHLLRFKAGGEPEDVCYWESSAVADEREKLSEEETDKEFAALFLDAVELRLVASDVPVGVFLSGGLDSSAIAAAAVELGHRNFHTFSVGFDEGGYYSELPYARQVAEHVGAQYHEVVVNRREFLDALPEVIYAADEPLADLTLVPLLAVSRLARRDVKVVLSGEGSDEILAGYNLDQMEREWDRVRTLQRVPRTLLETGAALSKLGLPASFQRRAEKLAAVPLGDWNISARPHITRYFDQRDKHQLWPGADGRDSERILSEQYAAAPSRDPLQQLLTVYQKSWLVEDLLMKADKMTMATSLEARTPFLDYRLVEWANRQPNSVKVKRIGRKEYRTKNVLRRFCASRLPETVLERPKRGFPVPAYRWLQDGLDAWARDTLLSPDNSRLAPVFERGAVERLIDEARTGAGDAPHRVWMLLVLELWLRAWDTTLA